jgi:N-acetylglucosaminyldiphosphoundecaprenol N-acetyl-beta-D-mannosaminyltransferase
VPVDLVDQTEALEAIEVLVEAGEGGTVFTPNVDHIVRAARDPAFLALYKRARLTLADGKPIVWTAQCSGFPLRNRVTGADMFMPLLALAAKRSWGVYIVGGRVGASDRLLAKAKAELPTLKVVGISPPTRAIQADGRLLDAEIRSIRDSQASLVLVCLGSPLQEVWSDSIASAVAPALLFGLGSAMDVAVGMQARAPLWMQQNGLEWLYRLGSDPKRLWKRYLVDDMQFAPIFVKTVFENRRKSAHTR